jgi:hypothetical protein
MGSLVTSVSSIWQRSFKEENHQKGVWDLYIADDTPLLG